MNQTFPTTSNAQSSDSRRVGHRLSGEPSVAFTRLKGLSLSLELLFQAQNGCTFSEDGKANGWEVSFASRRREGISCIICA